MRRQILAFTLTFSSLLLASPAHAQSPSMGVASVIDGDTIEIHGQRYRLHGIDAPESAQTCLTHQQAMWPCGRRVAETLDRTISGRTVRCEVKDQDRYGRMVAECFLGDQSINRWLVREGLAFAYRQYSQDYVADEEMARAEGKGIWNGQVQPPWEYRAQRRGGSPNAQQQATQGQLELLGAPVAPSTPPPSAGFRSCAEARAAGRAPVRRGDAGYSTRLDRDGDGVACE